VAAESLSNPGQEFACLGVIGMKPRQAAKELRRAGFTATWQEEWLLEPFDPNGGRGAAGESRRTRRPPQRGLVEEVDRLPGAQSENELLVFVASDPGGHDAGFQATIKRAAAQREAECR
jgi:hypothetical protein